MKKQISLMLGLLMVLSLMVSVSAWVGEEQSINLVQKDSSDWSTIEGGNSANLFLNQQMSVVWKSCKVAGVKTQCKTYVTTDKYSLTSGNVVPNTKYTLVYYGYGSHNDEYPYVTCIKTVKSGSLSVNMGAEGWVTKGTLSMSGTYKWTDFLDDGIDQKMWLVPTKDLDCTNHKFKNWNPDSILFETSTL